MLVRVEGHRWAIEDSFETAKNELGLDHNEILFSRYPVGAEELTLSPNVHWRFFRVWSACSIC